ncbi:MAG TPA: nitrilase-related carbon-nitrogen hydrolase [Bacillota bacterium]|jgi:predicted amidohydrolase|nr:nitrilase-related carbon-nitrogen hydrolase [Bacillota bacterium]HOP68819.1 nitrilase-related carbon-nitrogen hydrolase [Bacillota bacterium]HPT34137.1 nitrilase-related carbon-nitrogen hydrolase [Bacillota bacterium]HQD06090.1 nitrilase-related carbon-nitrogen hydrolase [Bacillota bacterium]
MPLDGWKERLFRRYLLYKCREERVRRHLRSRVKKLPAPDPGDGRRVRAAAVQVEIKLFKEPLDYVEEMHRLTLEAVEAGAQLIVFPEDNNLPLLGMLPGVEEAGKAVIPGDGEAPKKEPEITVTDVIRYVGPVVRPLIHTIFSTLARWYRVYIMAGSYLLPEGDRVMNRAILYGPDGSFIGKQDKVHLMPIEKEWGISRGSKLEVFPTPLGKLAFPVCMDATYFETFRILEKQGAEIVMIPIANPEPYNYWLALRGIWPRVQEAPVYGIKSALVGRVLGFEFTGRAGVFAPMELTPRGDGVLAELESPGKEGIAVADLDLEALQELRRNHPWRDSNEQLYQRYFSHLYQLYPYREAPPGAASPRPSSPGAVPGS